MTSADRHPCAGMKFPKVKMKLILGLTLLGCEYEVVDDSGKSPSLYLIPIAMLSRV
jgi:sterol 14-demethylase